MGSPVPDTTGWSPAAPPTVVVLAAGAGTRMRSALPKVLHPLAGRTLLGHVLAAAAGLGPARVVVVVGHGAEEVTAHLAQAAPDALAVVQAEQRGTGHAVRTALEALAGEPAAEVLVLPGDTPLLTTATLHDLVNARRAAGAAAAVLTEHVADPTGYGRVVREFPDGPLAAVVEQRDAEAAGDTATLAVREVNAGCYAFDGALLAQALGRLGTDNAQGEEYLTDVVGLLRGDGRTVVASPAGTPGESAGVNDRVQLAAAGAALRDRLVAAHQRAGVTVVDPATTWLDVDVELEADAVVQPGTQLVRGTRVAAGAVVGPDTTLEATEVGPGARVLRSHCEGAVVGAGASVGPFAFLRPGAVLGEGAKVGAFVEVKASTIGRGSKVPHLSYVGDALIGEGSNVGAGTITVNYDGRSKHRTTIGDRVRIGSNNSLVAPITVGDDAYTAAGSALTRDVPPGALGVARAPQRSIDGWAARKRPRPTGEHPQ